MEMMVPRRIQEIRKAKENQRLLEESSKKAPTQRQLNTLQVISELVAKYDQLQRTYTEDPTPKNKRNIQEYSLHLKSVNQLSEYFLQYISDKDMNTLTAPSKIRALITNELKNGTLIKINKLIRTPHTVPYDNVAATGNIITIMLPADRVDLLVETLVNDLIDYPVKFVVPCKNMVLIIEIGNLQPDMNHDLLFKIHQIIFRFFPNHGLMLDIFDEKNNRVILKNE